MSKITGINHITFATANLKQALEFYCDFLGGELVAKWDAGAYLLLGDLWLCLSVDEKAKRSPHDEYTHFAFTTDVAGFYDLTKRTHDQGVTVWKENKSEGESLYILDPDFNKLEIHVSNLKSRIQSMRAKPYQGMELNEDVIRKL